MNPVPAQILPNLTSESPKQELPRDQFNRETPNGSFLAFINAVQRDDNSVAAAQYLELPDRVSQKERDEILNKVRVVLDRRFFSPISAISKDPAGSLQDGRAPDKELAGVLNTKDGPVEIVLTRVNDGGNGRIWLVSKETLAQIPKIYEEIAPMDPDAYLPAVLAGTRIFSIPAGIFIAAFVLIPLAYAAAWLVMAAVKVPMRWMRPERRWANSRGLLLGLAVALHAGAIYYIGVPLLFRYYYGRALGLLLLFLLCLGLFKALDGIGARVLRVLRDRKRITAISFVTLAQRVVKALIAVSFVLIALSVLGFDLGTALAAIGIGGLAIALAAQKTLENLFGGASIIADEAIQVGDFCKIGNTKGIVEDIGLRSTRIRTLDRTTVTAPNSVVAGGNVENYSRRDKFWFHPTIGLRYETTAAQLRDVLSRIRAMLNEHPQVDDESARVRFIQFASYSLDLEVFAYVKAADFPDFLGKQEELLLKIMEIVETTGTAFAFPSQTMYLAKDK